MRKFKKSVKYLLFIFCLSLLLGSIYCASADTLSAKQMMLDKIKSSNFNYAENFYKSSSGSSSMEIKAIGGTLLDAVCQAKNLEGSSAKFDYKLNTTDKKLGADYSLLLNKKKLQRQSLPRRQ